MSRKKIKYQINPHIVWSGEEPDRNGYIWAANLKDEAEIHHVLPVHKQIYKSVAAKHSPEKAVSILKKKLEITVSVKQLEKLVIEMEHHGFFEKL